MKHNPGLISSLSYETSKMFTTAADSLSTLEPKNFGHWRAYFQLKSKFYMAQAFNYQGENMLGQDKCGEAIRSLQESQKSKLAFCALRPRKSIDKQLHMHTCTLHMNE